MKTYTKRDFAVEKVRRFLEPEPVVLLSAAHGGKRDLMTMGWHMILNDEPSLVGCFLWDRNYTRTLVEKSEECVLNVPTVDLVKAVIGIGNRFTKPMPTEMKPHSQAMLTRMLRLVSATVL